VETPDGHRAACWKVIQAQISSGGMQAEAVAEAGT